MRHLSDDERRARLGRRHALAGDSRTSDAVAATRAVVVLHATEPATVYLSLWARVRDLALGDVDAALYDDRSLVKQQAMRGTLFVFPRDLLPAAWGSASARVAAQLRPRLTKEVETGGLADDGGVWLDAACAAVRARLDAGAELSAQALREALPELDGRIHVAPGKAYGGHFTVAPRVLTQLGAEAHVMRGRNGGHWRISRPQWTATSTWLGETTQPWPARVGYAALVSAWLARFGPGTTTDLRWWLGGTASAVSQALGDVAAVEVELDGSGRGWVLPDDAEPEPEPAPWAALLPVLDPTVMGWKERDFYLGPHAAVLVDRNGNFGTTAWWSGRIVGCWVQDPDGAVRVSFVEDPGEEGRRALALEAERLGAWLDGAVVGTVYPSPAMKAGATGG